MNCEHERVQWLYNDLGKRTGAICIDCGDELEDLGDQVVPAAAPERGGPVIPPRPSDRDIRAEAIREDRFCVDPMLAKPERRIEG